MTQEEAREELTTLCVRMAEALLGCGYKVSQPPNEGWHTHNNVEWESWSNHLQKLYARAYYETQKT